MPTFYFELPDGVVIKTTGGLPLKDFFEAQSAAERMAVRLGEIKSDVMNCQLAVLIKTAVGKIVYRAEIAPLVERAGK